MKSNPLSFWMLVALVAGNMIGSGVFLLPASLAEFGFLGLLGWGLTSIGALFLALLFAEYAKKFVAAGGPYAYCRDAYGDFVGFQTAFNYWFALWVGNAAAVVAFVSYLAVFFPIILKLKWLSLLISLATIWLLTLINLAGVHFAGVVQMITTVLKILPLLLIGLVGFFCMGNGHFQHAVVDTSHHWSWINLGHASALCLWSFLGVESATVPSDDVQDPHKTIPRATIMGVLITMFVYISSAYVVMSVLPHDQLEVSTAPYADAAKHLFGNWAEWFVGFGAIVATFGSLNGMVLLQGQIPCAASRDGLFPDAFKSQTKTGAPKGALIISSCFISVLLMLRFNDSLVHQFTFIIKLATFATLIPYVFSSIGLLIYFRDRLTNQRIFISVMAFLYSLWSVVGSGEETVYLGTIVIFSALPIYYWIKSDEGRNKASN